MDDKVKKRLVGAVVLVCLGVIFIPMLLDERTPSRMPAFGSNVPAEPERRFDTLDIPLQLPEAPSRTRQTVVETQTEVQELEQAARARAPSEQSRPAPEKSPTPPVEQAKAPAPDSQPTLAAPSAPEPEAAGAPDGPKSWVVQVGSFTEPANAFRLRDRIRKNGFPAFVEQLRTGGAIAYRVRVGPELSRDRAEQLNGKLAAALQLEGLVMSQP